MHKNSDIPLLVAQTGPLSGQKWMLDTELVVGRDVNCDIVIPNRQVSRRHLSLAPTPEGIVLRDLNSKNGTHHNGKRIQAPVVLQDGDLIQVALAQEFIYVSADATVPLDATDLVNRPDPQRKLRLQRKSRRVWVGDVEIVPPLSAAQFKLLELLFEHGQKVVPRQELALAIWGEEGATDISAQALDALIRRLRDRIAEIDPQHNYIVAVRGHGVRLNNP